MSLFPAYAEKSKLSNNPKIDESTKWLQNSSFQIDCIPTSSTSEVTELKSVKRKHRQKHHKDKKLKVTKETPVIPESNSFIIDKTRNKEFLTANSTYRPPAPRYRPKYWINSKRIKKNGKFKRYYQRKYKKDDDKSNSDEEIITKKNLNKIGNKSDENFTGFKQEEDLSETTAYYNKELAKNPSDVKLWLKYVQFQETLFQFEKSYRKGSIAKGLRVMAERKLAILDKALNHSPNCEELMRERLNVCVSIYPSDELQVELRNFVDKDQGNIILWQGYIESYQCSMSHCNTPSVLKLYNKCLFVLHKLRRNSTMEKAQLEENILRMLYRCGLFLKQAGLFEQLWTLLRLYLELNLAPTEPNLFRSNCSFNETELVELEEVIFKSQLPLHELWLRTEKLRESCHWLPYAGDECEDPQRMVFPEDVAELIHPITIPENTFKLIVTVLSLLKVPLLPCRHTTFQDLGLDYVPWALDSIELLLPIFMNSHPIDLSNKNLIIDNRLTVGPQYLKVIPGQEEYLDFVVKLIKNCADCLKGDDRIVTTVWWMRFQKLLIVLEKQKRFKMPEYFLKKIKINIKNLLKQEDNRNNLIYYCEYAQIEFESGNSETCLNILQMALKKTQSKISATNQTSEQSNICHLNRILVEFYLREGKNEIALKQLISYVLEKDCTDINEDLTEQARLKFKHITLQLLQSDVEKLVPVEQLLPANFLTDWLALNGWFIYLISGPIQCGTFLEDILQKITCPFQREILYEFYVTVIFGHCLKNPGYGIYKILDDILFRAIESYPNNLFFLAAIARQQSLNKGLAWWRLKSLLMKTGRALPTLFLIVVANQNINELQETVTDTFTGVQYGINDNYKNKMLSLFRQLTKSDMCTRRCGLVWRLYLQFVHSYFDPVLCRNIYYTAVEECPWLKALYIDAAIYIPAELAQIQDLLIEKQLRLHVTPEELDILRS